MSDITLKPIDLVFAQGENLKTDSRKVAKAFGKQHRHVVRSIKEINSKIPLESGLSIFGEVSEFDEKANKHISYYEMTRDGFMLLVMGFTGDKAFKIKLAFVQAFNFMEKQLSLLSQYTKVCQIEDQEKAGASDCGRGLNAWKQIKRDLAETKDALESLMQPDLFKGTPQSEAPFVGALQ